MIVILGEGEEKEFQNDKTKKTDYKLQIPVSRVTDKATYAWTLSQTAINDLAQDFGTFDTARWVGATVRLKVRSIGQGQTLTGAVINRP